MDCNLMMTVYHYCRQIQPAVITQFNCSAPLSNKIADNAPVFDSAIQSGRLFAGEMRYSSVTLSASNSIGLTNRHW